MATQAAKRAETTVAEAPKRGRPAGGKNRTAEEKLAAAVSKFDYSRYRQTFQRPAEFYKFLEGYPEKSGLCAYIYRLKPRIDLSLIGIDDSHIHQTAAESEMTEDYCGETYGRGLYMCVLNDANRPKGQSEVCKTWFDCAMAVKPPQYDVRSLCLGESKNQDEITRLLNSGVLVRDAQTGAPRIRTEADGVAVPVAAPAANNDFFSRDVMGQVLVGLINRGSANPHDTVKDTIEIARMLAVPAAAPALDVEQVVERVVTRLRGVPAGENDPFLAYKRVGAMLRELNGGAVAGAADGSAVVAAVAGDGGASWAPHLAGIIGQIRAAVPEIVAGLKEMRGAEQQTNGNGGNGAVAQQRTAGPPTMEQRIEQIARLGLARMEEGVNGFEFAVYVWHFVPGGPEVYQFLEANGGALGLMSLITMNPATRYLVADAGKKAHVGGFLDEFFSFDPSGGSGGESEEPAVASPSR